jgi:hypothetical protein
MFLRWDRLLALAMCLAMWMAAVIAADLLKTNWNTPFP